jgi:hypothetical protein
LRIGWHSSRITEEIELRERGRHALRAKRSSERRTRGLRNAKPSVLNPKPQWKKSKAGNSHGTDHPGIVREAGNGLTCHGPNAEQHTHHAAGSAGSECIACHMPKIAENIDDVMVRSHTFRFVWPTQTDTMKISNACNLCHTDKTTGVGDLRSRADCSPWRAQ